MARDPRYDPLFEPLEIGPVTAPNRFYQVPHCSGMGYPRPQMMAAMRGIKAEGGWGVVCTEYCSIDASSDETPYPSASLRDDDDVRNLRRMTDAVHAQGSLAGVELWYGGHTSANLLSRELALDVGSLSNEISNGAPAQSRAMDGADILAFREMYQNAARRALDAGFDIIYVYACHYYLLHNFLNPAYNQRLDEYGGAVENRVRLLREVIEDVGEIVRGRAALAVRYSIPMDFDDDPQELVACFRLIAELPDLWDITVSDYKFEMGSSRFVKEAAHQQAVARLKQLTSNRWSASDVLPRPTRCWRKSPAAPRILSARRGRRSPIRSCRARSTRGGSRISANVSAVTFATRTIHSARRSAARKIRPWARNGAAAGIPIESKSATPTSRCSWSAPDPPDSKPRSRSASVVTR